MCACNCSLTLGSASDNLNAAAGPARVHMAVAQEQCLHLLHNPGVYAIDLLLRWVVCLRQRDGVPNLECIEAVKGVSHKPSQLGWVQQGKPSCSAAAMKWQEGPVPQQTVRLHKQAVRCGKQ